MTQILINSQEKYYDATNHLHRNIDFKECFWVIVQLKTLSCRNLNKAQKNPNDIVLCVSKRRRKISSFAQLAIRHVKVGLVHNLDFCGCARLSSNNQQ